MRQQFGSTVAAFALSLCAHATPALTPEEAWSAVQRSMTAGGQTLEIGSTERTGDTLTVTNVAIALAMPEGAGFSTTLPTLSFRDIGEGAVEVIYPASLEVSVTLPDAGPGAPKNMALTVLYDGLSMTARGEAASPVFDFKANSATVLVKEVKHKTGRVMDLSGALTMTGVSGNYALPLAQGDLLSGNSQLAVQTIAVTFEDKYSSEAVRSGTLAISDVKLVGATSMLAPDAMPDNISAALAAGMKVDTAISTGAVAMSFTRDSGAHTGGYDAIFASTSAKVFLDKTRIDYGFSVLGANIVARGTLVPLPEVATTFAETTFALSMPIAVSEQPQPFSLLVELIDFTFSEDVWAMFDPGARLPRDPVSFIVDLKGMGAWTIDILDPAAQAEEGPDLPAKLDTMDLTQLLAKAAGAQVAGTGALTFDNANLEALGGFPAPTGKITFTLTGINALIDAFMALGLLPEEDLMSARMGLAMLARPGAGPDELISEIEFQDGALTINGQPM